MIGDEVEIANPDQQDPCIFRLCLWSVLSPTTHLIVIRSRLQIPTSFTEVKNKSRLHKS